MYEVKAFYKIIIGIKRGKLFFGIISFSKKMINMIEHLNTLY